MIEILPSGYELIHFPGTDCWVVVRDFVRGKQSLTMDGRWVSLYGPEFVWNDVQFPSREALEEKLALVLLGEEAT